MKYKVIPFLPLLDPKNVDAAPVAMQLEATIAKHTSEGWKYVRLEGVTTEVAPASGCFGFGAKPGYTISVQLIVFERSE
jgi:hypothetical protein